MGGRGSGGTRVGAGRPKKDVAAKVLQGTATNAERIAPRQPAPAKLIAPPDGLSEDATAVWNDLAPHACAQRTLTDSTAFAFRQLCEAVVLTRKMADAIEANGLTYLKVTIDGAGQEHTEQKANPLLAQHRGMLQRVEQGMLRFRLSPMGKEIAAEDAPVDPFAEFEDKGSVN